MTTYIGTFSYGTVINYSWPDECHSLFITHVSNKSQTRTRNFSDQIILIKF